MRLAVLGLVLLPSIASAHIHLTFPLSRTDSLTGDQKAQHCGNAAYVRSEHPERNNVFAPGATITVTWMETIQHPGHFRIAFQPNGEDFGVPAPAAGRCKGTQACPAGVTDCDFPEVNQEGADATNGSIVLLDQIPDGMLSADITFPNMECTNCTLQFIQMMTDKCPYTADISSDDIYFNCADITLSAGAPDAGNPPPGDDAGITPGDDDGGTSGGCCSTNREDAPGTMLLGIAIGAGLLLRRRRR